MDNEIGKMTNFFEWGEGVGIENFQNMEKTIDEQKKKYGDDAVVMDGTITCRATRKACVVHCHLKLGSGKIEVNNREFTEYFTYSQR
jgi:hypothetical protein